MADVRKCDYPGCEETSNVNRFQLFGEDRSKEDPDTVDLCLGHQGLLLRQTLKVMLAECRAHKFLKEKGAIK